MMLTTSRYKAPSTISSIISSSSAKTSRSHTSSRLLSLSLTNKPHHQQRTMSSFSNPSTKPPLPPFTRDTAVQKVKAAQDLWNTRNPSLVKNGYTPDSIWRNRDTFLKGTDEIVEFLTKKWSVENGYRLRKELFAFTDDKWKISSGNMRYTTLTRDSRSQFNFGTNGTIPPGNGGVLMGWKTGPSRLMDA